MVRRSQSLQIDIATLDRRTRGGALLIPVTVRAGRAVVPRLEGFDGATQRHARDLAAAWPGRTDAGAIDTQLISRGPFARLALICLGKARDDGPEPADVRIAAAAAARWAVRHRLKRVGLAADALRTLAGDEAADTWADAALLADFRYDAFRAPTPGDDPPTRAWTMVMLTSKPMPAARRRRLHAAAVVAESANLARFYSHEPPNVINPPALARRAAAEAQRVGLRCTIIDERRMAAMDMNALMAVGRGSAAPPRLIVLEHRGTRSAAAPIVLVGKAVTQDTGGYSIKAADGIPDMKFDKCGGMAVLGAMIAAARLRLPARVVGVIPAAENMIDARAFRPGDILTAMSGRTIEVISTDAEGRLMLADALTYAQQLFRPRLIIDLATLTGACVVALGQHAAGLFSNDDELASRLIAAGDAVGERLWRMPLWPAYRKQIEGTDADLKNSGGRPGGAVTAAMFLKEFVDDGVPWAHLDIAGTAHLDKETPLFRRGATGFGVRLLLRLLRD